MNESDISDYLLAHPDFFERHAELLGQLRLISPSRQRAVSLHERQIELQREKNKQLERRLSELLFYGHQNDQVVSKMHQWILSLLSEAHHEALPNIIEIELLKIFDLPLVALQLWPAYELSQRELTQHQSTQHQLTSHASSLYMTDSEANARFIHFSKNLSEPYCGVCPEELKEAVSAIQHQKQKFFKQKPLSETEPTNAAEPSAMRPSDMSLNIALSFSTPASIAILPLRFCDVAIDAEDKNISKETFISGVLLLGSEDASRFDSGMSKDFLLQISALASASLSRWHKQSTHVESALA